MATGKRLKAAILARRAAKRPRKKRTRPEPRQYTVIAVGTSITGRPPHRSVRADFPHTAPTSGR
jgi:chemotaxis response regulator CheB